MKKIVKYGLIGFVGLGVLGAILPDQPVQNIKADKMAANLEKKAIVAEKTPAIAEVTAEDSDNSKQIAKIEKELKREPKIKDLMRNGAYWNVGLIPDGTPRYGYAEYVCNVIRDGGAMNQSGPTYVRTVNIVSVANENASPREASMGAVDCSDFSHFDA